MVEEKVAQSSGYAFGCFSRQPSTYVDKNSLERGQGEEGNRDQWNEFADILLRYQGVDKSTQNQVSA